MRGRPSVIVGTIVVKEGQVLLIKRNMVHGAGCWSAPGGHLEFGESLEECAIREMREETNLIIGNVRFRAITNDFFEEDEKHYTTIWMEGIYIDGEAMVASVVEVTEVGWFDWDELPAPLFGPFASLLEGRCYPFQSSVGEWKEYWKSKMGGKKQRGV